MLLYNRSYHTAHHNTSSEIFTSDTFIVNPVVSILVTHTVVLYDGVKLMVSGATSQLRSTRISTPVTSAAPRDSALPANLRALTTPSATMFPSGVITKDPPNAS